jgi:hypothetical protein
MVGEERDHECVQGRVNGVCGLSQQHGDGLGASDGDEACGDETAVETTPGGFAQGLQQGGHETGRLEDGGGGAG